MVRIKNNKRYIMVYNGELYNTEDIKVILKNRGYQFQGHSDTEVLLLSYIEWGEGCLDYLNGIFAFAIWDEEKERLFAARDRIGVKPLFYARISSGLIFASEIKSLLEHPELEAVVDREGIAEIISIGPGRTPGQGIFKDVRELKPGHYLIYSQEKLLIEPYWQLESKIHGDSLEETVNHLRYLFTDTVRRQLVSDVPICTLLSGGLDSSAISAVAAQELTKNGFSLLDTYSVDYEDNDIYFEANSFQPDTDEYWARFVSDFIGSNHHHVVIDNSILADSLYEAMVARDLPGMADIDVSLYLFSKEIKKEFVVAVSGECADEIFGGYPWFYSEEAFYGETFPWSRGLEERVTLFADDILRSIKPVEYVKERYNETLLEVPLRDDENSEEKRMRELFYMNLTRWMPTLLDRKDRMSMFTGLEIRVPFCDHRLVEYVWNIPWEMKNYHGMRKGILREALRGILPEEVRTRPKNPYPKTFSPFYYKRVRNELLGVIEDPDSPILQLVNKNRVIELSRHDGDFDLPWFGQLMRLPQLFAYLLQLNSWLETYDIKLDLK